MSQSTTPRTDKFASQLRGLGTGYYQALDFARQLETELVAMTENYTNTRNQFDIQQVKLQAAQARIEVLEKDKEMLDWLLGNGSLGICGGASEGGMVDWIDNRTAIQTAIQNSNK